MKNRERILKSSLDYFNLFGVASLSTNHIAKYMNISPGNLYFHFSNKEQIIRELFKEMCDATYEAWKPVSQKKMMLPQEFAQVAMEVFWRYRFFHREMYYMKRRDAILALGWKKHIRKTMKLMRLAYGQWIRAGIMVRVRNLENLQILSDTVLFTASGCMNFYESPAKPANKRAVTLAVTYILKLLSPYLE